MKQSMAYLPQPEQEQSAPQLPTKEEYGQFNILQSRACPLPNRSTPRNRRGNSSGVLLFRPGTERERESDLQLEAPEHPQSPFILMVGLVWWEKS